MFLLKNRQFTNNSRRQYMLLVLVVVFCLFFNVFAQPVGAAFNKKINYQGKLADSTGQAVADDDYNMRFKICSDDQCSSVLWTETRTTTNRVDVTSGLFSIMLGDVTSLASVDFNQMLYLEVEIGGIADTPAWDGAMTPRRPFGAVPAAFVADTLDGLDSTDFVASTSQSMIDTLDDGTAGQVAVSNGTSGLQYDSGFFWDTANDRLGIGTDSPSYNLEISGTNSATNLYVTGLVGGTAHGSLSGLTLENSNNLYFYDSNAWLGRSGNALEVHGNDGIRFLNNGSTEWMRINSSGNLGLATTTPTSKLTIEGDGTTSATYGLNVADSTGAPNFVVRDDGRVGIGTDSPASTLHVNGGTGGLATGLAFGDGDSGFYEESDDDMILSLGGAKRVQFLGLETYFGSSGAYAMIKTNDLASVTNPVFVPYGSDTNTGIGGDGSDILAFIAGGNNIANVNATSFGVASTTPGGTYGEKLTVAGDAYITGLSILPEARISVLNTTTTVADNLTVTNSVTLPAGSIDTSGLSLTEGYTLRGEAGSAEATSTIYMSDNGSVGIGTVSPSSAKVVIKGGGVSDYTTELNTISSGNYGLRTSGPAKARHFYLYNTTGGFYAYDGTPMFYSNNTGNFGVATTTPTARLTIEGTGNSSASHSLRVTDSDGGDVFTVRDDSQVYITPATGTAPVLNINEPDGTDGIEFRTGYEGKANMFIGNGSGKNVKSEADYNVGLGFRSLYDLTTGTRNMGLGTYALQNNTSGRWNMSVGAESLNYNTTGDANVGIGVASLYYNDTGSSNVGIGYYALRTNALGAVTGNVGIGSYAAFNTTNGSNYNTSLGYMAGRNFGGDNNVLIGADTGYLGSQTEVGGYNIFIGNDVGDNATAGADNNILIGKQLDLQTAGGDNQLSIGNLLFGTGLDGTGTTVSGGKIGIATSTPDAKLSVYSADNGVDGLSVYKAADADNYALRVKHDSTADSRYIAGFQSANGDVMVIRADGSVGVGTTTPWGRLSVKGDDTDPSLIVGDASNNTDFIVTGDGYVGVGTDNPIYPLDVSGNIRGNAIYSGLIGNVAADSRFFAEDSVAFLVDYNNNDSDTEVFTWGKNSSVTASSEELMRLTETGILAIGTDSPNSQSKLHVNGSSLVSQNMYVGTINNIIRTNGSEFQMQNQSSGGIISFFTNDGSVTEKVRIANSGAIGVGSTTPGGTYGEKLTVAGDGYFTGSLYLDGTLNAASTVANLATTTVTGDFTVQDSDSNTTLYVDNNDGRVGVGTTTPATALDVTGGNNTQIAKFAGDTHAFFDLKSGLDTENALMRFGNGYDNTTWAIGHLGTVGVQKSWGVYNFGTSGVPFGIEDDAVGGLMHLKGGSVGIATTTPTSKLTIEGGGTTSATSGLNVTDSTGKNILEVRDDSNVTFTAATGTAPVMSVDFSDGTNNFEIRTGYENKNNLFIGKDSGANILSEANDNVALGHQTLAANTTGDRNVAIGMQALLDNTTGSNNFGLGYAAMFDNISGIHNTAIGSAALMSNTTANYNVGLGGNTLLYNETGGNNIAIGRQAGQGVSNSSNVTDNVFIGHQAAMNVLTGADENVAVGYYSGGGLTTGVNNVLFGARSGDEITTGSNNIVIGYDIDAPSNTGSNQMTIGNLLFGTGIDGIDTSISSGNIGVASTTPWGRLSVKGDDADPSLVVGDASNNTDFIVTADGKVGVGTGNPAEKLEVYGDMAIGSDSSSDNDELYFDARNENLTWDNDGSIAVLGTDHAGTFVLSDSLMTAGNIGIATSTPTSKLTIEGDGTTSATFGLNVTDSDGAPSMVVRDDGRVGIGTNNPRMGLELYGKNIYADFVSYPSNPSGTAEAGSGLEIGTYYYRVTYYTSDGETRYSNQSNAVETTSGNQQVSLTIPTSSDSRVIGRKIYRGAVNSGYDQTKYVATVADNTTVTYTDTTPDASLGSAMAPGGDTTAGIIMLDGTPLYQSTSVGTSFGYQSAPDGFGRNVTTFGSYAGNALTYGPYNSLFGFYSGVDITTGSENSLFGSRAGQHITTGSQNVGIGNDALRGMNGEDNTAVGAWVGYKPDASGDTSANNVYVGRSAGLNFGGSQNVIMGYYAGSPASYETDMNNNVIIGYDSGDNATTGASSNILIGNQVDMPVPGGSNQLSIGNLIFGTSLNGTNTVVSTGNIGIASTTPWGRLSVKGDDTDPSLVVGDASSNTDFIVAADGKVGFGTSSPDSKIAIYQNSYTAEEGITFDSTDGSPTNNAIYRAANGQLAIKGGNGTIYVDSGDLRSGSGFRLRNAAGSVTSPTYSFNSDINTGMYNPAADQISLVTGGTSAMFINSSGAIGVGSTTPGGTYGEKLTVVGSSYVTGDAYFGNQVTIEGGTPKLYFSDTGSKNWQIRANGDDLEFWGNNAASEYVTFVDGGSVGVGSTTPGGTYGEKLTVAGDGYFTGSLYLDGTLNAASTVANLATTTVTGDFTVQDSDSNTTLYVDNNDGRVGVGTDSPADKFNIAGSAYNVRSDGDAIGVYSGSSDRAVMSLTGGDGFIHLKDDSNNTDVKLLADGVSYFKGGDVGIGTDSPAAKLNVFGTDNKIRLSYDTSNYSDISVNSSGYLSFQPGNGRTYFNRSGVNNNFYVYDYTSDSNTYMTFSALDFAMQDSGSQNVRLRATSNADSYFNSGGDVGIATSTPTSKLTIEGDGTTSATHGLNITNSDGENILAVRDDSRVKIGISEDITPDRTLDVAGNMNFDSVAEPVDSGMVASLAGLGAGNVDDGQHYYAVVYVTADGGMTGSYTPTINVTVTDKSTNGQVSLTNIPTSPDPRVVARRIYRNKVGESHHFSYYLATINDNTTTSYTDNTADSGLDTTDYIYRKANTTSGVMHVNDVQVMQATDIYHTSLGYSALQSNTLGNSTVAIGGNALRDNTTGNNNNALGYSALILNTTGSQNNAYGYAALQYNTTGSYNTAVGTAAIGSANGSSNTAVGYSALSSLVNGNDSNTALGYRAGTGFQGDGNLFLGHSTGYISSATAGDYNIFMGYDVGDNVTAGADNNILIGKQLDLQVTGGDNQLSIGNLIFGTGLDGTGTTVSSGSIGIGTTTPGGTYGERFTVTGDAYITGNATTTHLAVTGGNSDQWNEAYSWGDHSSSGYLASTDIDTFSEIQSVVADKTLVNEEDIFTIDANWVNTANPWADNEIASSGDWNSAFGWGNHASAGYLTSASINTYSELNAIVADVTLTHNGLIDSSSELAGIVGDETGSGSLVFATSPTFGTQISTPKIVTASGALDIQAASGIVAINTASTQNYLRVYDSASTDYLQMTHDGSNAVITTNVGNVEIGTSGNDVYIGAVGSASNLVFEESASILGQGGNAISFGQSGDTFNLNMSGVSYNFSTLTGGSSLVLNASSASGTSTVQISNDDATDVASLVVEGTITTGGTTIYSYNNFGSGTAGQAAITDEDDVYVAGDLEVDGTAYLSGGTSWTQGDFAEHIVVRQLAEGEIDNDIWNDEDATNTEEFLEEIKEEFLALPEAGDVLVVDPEQEWSAVKSYDYGSNRILGVVSTDPAGILRGDLARTGNETRPLALSGTVPVKVSLENGPIEKGDLLTTSKYPGYATKLIADNQGVVGIALESYLVNESERDSEVADLIEDTLDEINEFKEEALVEGQEEPVKEESPEIESLRSGKQILVLLALDNKYQSQEEKELREESVQVVEEIEDFEVSVEDYEFEGNVVVSDLVVTGKVTVVGESKFLGEVELENNLNINGAIVRTYEKEEESVLEIGDAVYLTSKGKVQKAYADVVDENDMFRPAIGLVVDILEEESEDSETIDLVKVAIGGTVGGFEGLSAGSIYYLASVEGQSNFDNENDGVVLGDKTTASSTEEVMGEEDEEEKLIQLTALTNLPEKKIGVYLQTIAIAESDNSLLIMPSLSYQEYQENVDLPTVSLEQIYVENLNVDTGSNEEEDETGDDNQNIDEGSDEQSQEGTIDEPGEESSSEEGDAGTGDENVGEESGDSQADGGEDQGATEGGTASGSEEEGGEEEVVTDESDQSQAENEESPAEENEVEEVVVEEPAQVEEGVVVEPTVADEVVE